MALGVKVQAGNSKPLLESGPQDAYCDGVYFFGTVYEENKQNPDYSGDKQLFRVSFFVEDVYDKDHPHRAGMYKRVATYNTNFTPKQFEKIFGGYYDEINEETMNTIDELLKKPVQLNIANKERANGNGKSSRISSVTKLSRSAKPFKPNPKLMDFECVVYNVNFFEVDAYMAMSEWDRNTALKAQEFTEAMFKSLPQEEQDRVNADADVVANFSDDSKEAAAAFDQTDTLAEDTLAGTDDSTDEELEAAGF